MSRSLFLLSDAAWAAIEPHLPKDQPGARRVDDRRIISGVVHMLKCGAVGRTARVSAGLRQRSTIAGTDGAVGASGLASL
jgi:transposase